MQRILAAPLTLVITCVLIAGCSTARRRVDLNGDVAEKAAVEIPENQLLDVWIELFDPGQLPKSENAARGLSMVIREAEARFMPVALRTTMEKTGYWGAVRVVPRNTEGAEVTVSATIQKSDGKSLNLQVTAEDASGRQWFDRDYEYVAPSANDQAAASFDPLAQTHSDDSERFEPLYNAITNDLAEYRNRLEANDIVEIRQLAELRFAADLAPQAFAEHVETDANGRKTIARLPAEDDPMYARIRIVRERDFMLIDTLSGRFDNFHREMQPSYDGWREARSAEADAAAAIEREALTRQLLGAASILGVIGMEIAGVGGSSTRTLRNVMVVGGALAIKSGFDKAGEAEIHHAAIEELGESFTLEAQPMVVDVEGKTVELTGSAEAQYSQWRDLLRRVYASETGISE